MLKPHFFLLLILLFAFDSIQAQDVLRNNPPSVKWKQIITPGFKVIFPAEFEAEANKVANTLEHIREPESQTMGDGLPRRIPIVIQNNNAISNGFVALGPRRSEFYTQPSQNYNFTGTNKWLDLLAIHEYRHIAQFNRSRSGFTKFFYYLFGQNTQAGFAFVAAPRWFWEGDATLIETAMSPSGRGRIPEWDRVFRANLMEGKRFNYNKQHLGSFKDRVPDHYRLGYHMTAHIRKRTNKPEIWNHISKSAFSIPFIPFTFSNSMKKHTGEYLTTNYEMMMDEMKELWSNQVSDLNPTAFEIRNRRIRSEFTDYAYPQTLEDGSIVAFKSGLSDMGQLVRIDSDGNEVKSFITGVMNQTEMLSATQFKVYWNEYEYDPRWRAKTYSVIKSYDFATKELKRITRKSRYAGAGISSDGYKLVTVLNTTENKNYLVVLDAISGNEIKRFDNDITAEYGMPTWSSDGKSIVSLKITDKGKSVIKVDFDSGSEIELIEPGHENIGSPYLFGNYLLFSSPYNGIDNLYALDVDKNIRYQITRSKYGAYSPALSSDKSTLVYAEHTVNGLNVVSTSFTPSTWTPLNMVVDRNVNLIDEISEQEGHEDLLSTVPSKTYESKKYSKLTHMFNLHSWGPFLSTDINTAQVGVFSRDVLSTTRTSVGYTYDATDDTGFASAGISYQAWYPVIDFNYDIGNRKTGSYQWEETTVNTGLSIPLLLTRSRFFRTLTISNSVGIRDISSFRRRDSNGGRDFFDEINLVDGNDVVVDTITVFQVDATDLDNGQLMFNNLSLSFSNLLKVAPRNLRSRWGQFFTFEHYTTINGDFDGGLTGVRGGLFFPSPFELLTRKKTFINHSLNFRFGSQEREVVGKPNEYSFRNVIFKPRGFSYPNEKSFTSLLTNYEFPLIYPDLAIGPILYIKRIKMNLFYDFGREEVVQYLFTTEPFNDFQANDLIRTSSSTNEYVSFGAELTFDFNIMRFPINIEMGVRILNRQANRFNTGGTALEFIFAGVNL